MRCPALLMLLPSLPALLAAQDAPAPAFSTERIVSLTAGIGNSMGWFGVQGERYLADERLSIFVGLGYAPRLERGDRTGPSFAAGVRSFTAGRRHRAFVEGSVSQLQVETLALGESGRLYGPGLQGGYQFVSTGGFTFMASLGLGYALAVPRGLSPWAGQVGLGAGFTWRRQRSDEGRFDRYRR